MLHYLAVASLLAYLLSTVLFLLSVLNIKVSFNKNGRVLLFIAFLLQTILIVPILAYDSEILKGSGGYLFWFAWSISFIYFVTGKHSNYPLVGAFVSPLGAFFLSASSYLSHQVQSDNTDNYAILMMHVVPAFISELCLLVALIISSIYLIQSKRIKKKLSAVITAPAPSLVILENSNQACLLIGFISMTIAILGGVYWQASNNLKMFSGDPYQGMALLVWVITAALLHARTNLGYSASRIARLTIYLALPILAGTIILIFLQGIGFHQYAG